MRKMVDIDKVEDIKYQLGTASKLLNYLLEKDYVYLYYADKNKSDSYYQIARAQELYVDTQNILNIIFYKMNEVLESLDDLSKEESSEEK